MVNQTWTDCGNSCETTCANILGVEPYKFCPAMCLTDYCKCSDGYVRISEEDRSCVLEDECSNYYPTTDGGNSGKKYLLIF